MFKTNDIYYIHYKSVVIIRHYVKLLCNKVVLDLKKLKDLVNIFTQPFCIQIQSSTESLCQSS